MKISKYEVIRKIMESQRLNEEDQAYYIKEFCKGNVTVEEIEWIWE